MRGIAIIVMFLVLASSVSAFVVVKHWDVAEDDLYYEFVDNTLYLDISEMENDDIKVVFTVPELGARASKGYYAPDSVREDKIQRAVLLPYDADYGEYVVRMTITDKEGNKRIRHRIIEIE
jgi:hypothetical protein